MENHPIPQDVTGFQFKLVGAMTVKQFGYVASGVVAAVVLYYLPLNSAFGVLLKVLLIPLLGSSGAIIAFVPVDGRPIDLMTSNFVKALFSPNQYVYHRSGRKLSFDMLTLTKAPVVQKSHQQMQYHHSPNATQQLEQKEKKLRELLLNSKGRVVNAVDKKETAFLNTLTTPPPSFPVLSTQQAVTNPLPVSTLASSTPPTILSASPEPSSPSKKPLDDQDALSKKESELVQALSAAKQEDATSTTPETRNLAQHKVTVLSKQIEEIHAQKQQLEQELSHLQEQLASQKSQNASLPSAPVQPIQDPQHVRTIPKEVTQKVGLPHVSDSPNVVVGIVKDPRGNILPNILVEVKDKDNNPVRAFKTNQLGQFASATPLSPGTYTLDLEDPKKQHRFDIIQITANNQILLPIEVISHDAREELRKQLFAN